MTPADLQRFFNERRSEVDEYVSFLQDIDAASQSGPPRLQGIGQPITVSQHKILMSSLYLQLYNLVEATFSQALVAIQDAAFAGSIRARDLGDEMLSEWVRAVARTHEDLNPGNRLQAALDACRQVVDDIFITGLTLDMSVSGNLDDTQIEKLGDRLGLGFRVTPATRTGVKWHVRDDMGAMALVKHRRNHLAHGALSFVDCADNVSVSELASMTASISAYLVEFVDSVVTFIAGSGFLKQLVATSGL